MKYNSLILQNIALLIGITLALSGCKTPSSIVIEDIAELKQDHYSYLAQQTNKAYIPKRYHHIIEREFRRKFLRPWKHKKTSIKKESLVKTFKNLSINKGFGENKQPLEEGWVSDIRKNANLERFPNYVKKAITIANTNLRLIPTHKPRFNHFNDDANGFPFDTLQNSKLAANTPILITHISKDNAWVLVETPVAHGWIPIRDIAYAGPKFIEKFKKNTKYIAATEDNFPIKTVYGTYLYQGNIGMVFPLLKEEDDNYHVITCMTTSKRYAYTKEAVIPKTHAVKKPYPLTKKNIALICNKLTGKTYGWGGLYNNRDCSAMIQDLFTPFSIWLPRNSASQAKKGGLFIDLKHLDDKQKETFIQKNGIPYLTLLWFPGHIMLYIGEKEGKALVFHSIWGLRTHTEKKRKIIGKSVITTLKPGEELNEVDDEYNLLTRISGMTLLVPRYY